MRVTLAILALTIGGSFNTGCIPAGVRQQMTDYMVNDLIPKGTEALKNEGAKLIDAGKLALEEKGEAILKKKIQDDYAALDARLEQVAEPDPDTGIVMAKTWRDFDKDRSDVLEPTERAAADGYVMKKALAKGDMGLAGKAATGGASGVAVAAAMAYLQRRRKKNGDTDNGGSTPEGPDVPPAGRRKKPAA